MERRKNKISLLVYYLLVANLINLIGIILGLGVLVWLFPFGEISNLFVFLIVLLLVLLPKGILIASVMYWLQKHIRLNISLGEATIGKYFCRFYGMAIGAMLGGKLAGWPGAIIGAMCLDFLGIWAGPRIGLSFGKQIGKVFILVEQRPEEQSAA